MNPYRTPEQFQRIPSRDVPRLPKPWEPRAGEAPTWLPHSGEITVRPDAKERMVWQPQRFVRLARLVLVSDRFEHSRVSVLGINIGVWPLFASWGGVPILEFQSKKPLSELMAAWCDPPAFDSEQADTMLLGQWNLDHAVGPGLNPCVELTNLGEHDEKIGGAFFGFACDPNDIQNYSMGGGVSRRLR